MLRKSPKANLREDNNRIKSSITKKNVIIWAAFTLFFGYVVNSVLDIFHFIEGAIQEKCLSKTRC